MDKLLTGTAVALTLWVAGAGVTPAGQDAEYTRLDRQGQPLRAAFNAAAGKVRVLMLVAPT